MKEKECVWVTKTPFASIRRIVQTRPEIFKVRPGLWALKTYQKKLGLEEYGRKADNSLEFIEQNHSYYQGLILEIGNKRGLGTFLPNQDRNKRFLNKTLGDMRTLHEVPKFSYEPLVHQVSSIDVSWFNDRKLPSHFFEIEHSTNFINSMNKFIDLQDFSAKMSIVASENRHGEFREKCQHGNYQEIRSKIYFLNCDEVVKQYENEISKVDFF
jgi:hypothetical protein